MIPEIKIDFMANLLSVPMPYMGDDSDTLIRIFNYINIKLAKRVGKCPIRQKKFIKLQQEFLDLYEKIEKKELEKEAEGSGKEPFHFIRLPDKRRQRIFWSLRKRANRFQA
jgi:hypothetical protein